MLKFSYKIVLQKAYQIQHQDRRKPEKFKTKKAHSNALNVIKVTLKLLRRQVIQGRPRVKNTM